MAGKKGGKNSAKPKDGKKVGKKDVQHEKQLVLTPSEKALGIRITQPKQKTIDSMTRLYAVPSEKLRVWSSWLTKVGERGTDWQWWLRAQIGLALRISQHLQQATLALQEEEKRAKLGQGDEAVEEEEGTKETATEIKEADFDENVTTLSPEQEAPSTKEGTPTELQSDVVAEDGEHVKSDEPNVQTGVSEGNENAEVKGADKTEGRKAAQTKKTKQGEKIVYKEGFWPVGVRWKPMSQRNKQNPPNERQPEEIPMPNNEVEMEELMRKIRHQGVVYRSLYKHWSKTADEAVKHTIGRKVLPTNQVYDNGADDVPYIFYLESEPDIDYVIEHDDEEVLLADPGRERITHNFTHLYFNLLDKPGKGGKPWI